MFNGAIFINVNDQLKCLSKHVHCLILIFLLIIIFILPAFCQTFEIDTIYNESHGLENPEVNDILSDEDGYLWLATNDGLYRFDGQDFELILGKYFQSILPSREIYKLKRYNTNHILVVARYGVFLINTKLCNIQRVEIPKQNINKKYQLRNVLITPEYEIIIINKGGLFHFDKNLKPVLSYFDYTENDESGNFGTSYALVDNNTLYIQRRNSHKNLPNHCIYKISERKMNIFHELPYTKHNPMLNEVNKLHSMGHFTYKCIQNIENYLIKHNSDSIFFSDNWHEIENKVSKEKLGWRNLIFEVDKNTLGISNNSKGFYTISKSSGAKIRIEYANTFLSSYKIFKYFKDINGIQWFGTNRGLVKIKDNTDIRTIILPASNYKLSLANIQLIQNKIVAGLQNESLLIEYDEKQNTLKKTNIFLPKKTSKFRTDPTLKYDNHRILVGGKNLMVYNLKNKQQVILNLEKWKSRYNWISAIFKDSKNQVWVFSNSTRLIYKSKPGTLQFELLNLTQDEFKKIGPIYGAIEKNGYIYFRGYGVLKYDPQINKVIKLYEFDNWENSLHSVRAMEVDEKENIWVACGQVGLIHVNQNTGRYTTYNESHGLSELYIASLFQSNDTIWIATLKSIYLMDSKTKHISKISSRSKLGYKNLYTSFFTYDSLHNRLLYPAENAIVVIPKSNNYIKKNQIRIIPYYYKINNQNTPLPKSNKINLPWDKRNASISFNFVSFSQRDLPLKLHYKIIRQGEDKEWNEINRKQEIKFDNISFGSYKLYVKSSQNNVETLEYNIKIGKPWWASPYAIVLYALGLACSFYLYKIWKLKGIQDRNKQLEKLVAVKSKELEAAQQQLIENQRSKLLGEISRSLHDDIGTNLTKISLSAYMANQNIKNNTINDASKIKSILSSIESTTLEITEKLKDLIWFVKPENKDIGDLFYRLEEYASHVAVAKEIKLKFIIDENAKNSNLTIPEKFQLFLSSKEAIANAVKHSEADEIKIEIDEINEVFSIRISDNGKGIELTNPNSGNGLNNMQKRLKSINGSVQLLNNTPQGLIVVFEVPVKHDQLKNFL